MSPLDDEGMGPHSDEMDSQPPMEEGAPPWVTTFGDLMSLLLTFFILLFSMSEMEIEKFLLASQSLREAMGGTPEQVSLQSTGSVPGPMASRLQLDASEIMQSVKPAPPGSLELERTPVDRFVDSWLEIIRQDLQKFVEDNGLEETVRVEKEPEGVYLRIQTSMLFGSGEVLIQPEARRILEELTRITSKLKIAVVVSGHADDRPIRSAAFPSNWELSAARAAGVARYLVEHGHPPTMVQVESYGEFRPIGDNETPEGRAKNRRVELFYSRADVQAAAMALDSLVLPER